MTTITTALPNTRFSMPSDKECASLLAIVEAAHPDWKVAVGIDEFRRAMIAVGGMWRLDAPSTQYSFASHLDHANGVLRERRLGAIDGPALLRAIVGHNDVPWRAPDRRVGQVLEVGLDVYSGRPCSNGWRGVLRGDPLRPPLAPRRILQQQAEPSPVRYYQEDRGGRMQPVGPDVDLWRR